MDVAGVLGSTKTDFSDCYHRGIVFEVLAAFYKIFVDDDVFTVASLVPLHPSRVRARTLVTVASAALLGCVVDRQHSGKVRLYSNLLESC